MNRMPTNLEIMERIYSMYRDRWLEIQGDDEASGPYVPIDVRKVAESLKTDAEELFGRLYYDLDAKYRYRQEWGPDGETNLGARVHFFLVEWNGSSASHEIHLPYLAGLMSVEREKHGSDRRALRLSIISLFAALAAVVAQVAQIVYAK